MFLINFVVITTYLLPFDKRKKLALKVDKMLVRAYVLKREEQCIFHLLMLHLMEVDRGSFHHTRCVALRSLHVRSLTSVKRAESLSGDVRSSSISVPFINGLKSL